MGRGQTKNAIRVLFAIKKLSDEKGYAPTFKEIAEELGMLEQSVQQAIQHLKTLGIIEMPKYKKRAIRVTPDKAITFLLRKTS